MFHVALDKYSVVRGDGEEGVSPPVVFQWFVSKPGAIHSMQEVAENLDMVLWVEPNRIAGMISENC